MGQRPMSGINTGLKINTFYLHRALPYATAQRLTALTKRH